MTRVRASNECSSGLQMSARGKSRKRGRKRNRARKKGREGEKKVVTEEKSRAIERKVAPEYGPPSVKTDRKNSKYRSIPNFVMIAKLVIIV